ncbi:hypothetical protein QBC39DRAFT_133858 [Podospora conica]|nr:hypothetical protein QBC39DRAFT_133858 [Schizothecium conicum]
MALLHPAIVEGVRVVARQAVETTAALTSAVVSDIVSATPSPTGVTLSSSFSSSVPDTTANGGGINTSLPPTQNGNPGNNNTTQPQSGGNSSPLLFFVALGFGVVFTNLWIIVGVKYCFRYNARSRQMRMNEDGEPINMENMPRPHRRRREKKLMTMDEVNEKFPMMKYKSWVATRVQEGLPTRGGVSSPSRPGSLRDADGVAPELPSKESMTAEERPTTSAAANSEKQGPKHATKESTSSTVNQPGRTSTDARLVPTISESATLAKEPNRASHDDDEEDDAHINAALPPECMGTSGDTCAICIDTLEDDDDVRGLTCGHAFHAVCLDPWLTSRRACCPLCKADYYTPKPRAHHAETADVTTTGVITVTLPGDRRDRMNLPGRPRHAFFGLGRGGQSATQASSNQQSGRRSTSRGETATQPSTGFFGAFNRSAAPAPSPTRTEQTQPQSEPQAGRLAAFRSALPTFGRRQAEPNAVTPSNLEAGTRT